MELMDVISVSGTESDVHSYGKPEGYTSTSSLSTARWFSLHIMADAKRFCFGEDLLYLKWTSGVQLLHSLGGSVSFPPRTSFYWSIFCLKLVCINAGPLMIHE